LEASGKNASINPRPKRIDNHSAVIHLLRISEKILARFKKAVHLAGIVDADAGTAFAGFAPMDHFQIDIISAIQTGDMLSADPTTDKVRFSKG